MMSKHSRVCTIKRKNSNDSIERMCEKYLISGDVIGVGAFSKVFEAWFKSDPDHKVAMKVIPKLELRYAYYISPNKSFFNSQINI